MVGPMDFTMNDESGILIEGHELQPMIRQPWHPPHYQRLCEGAGLEKAKDLYSWELDISDRGTTLLPVLEELAVKAREEHGVTIRRMSRRHLRRELDLFAELYNEAWSKNWGFVPYAKEDLDTYALDLQAVYNRNWFMAAEKDGETIAIAITPIDINQVLKRMRGRILPTGWWHFLNRNRICDRVRIGFLGVRPEYQHTGVAAALYIEHFDTAARARAEKRRGGLDPRGQRGDEPRPGGDGGEDRQALPGLRAPAAGVGKAHVPALCGTPRRDRLMPSLVWAG